jgi:zinc transporter ZupT
MMAKHNDDDIFFTPLITLTPFDSDVRPSFVIFQVAQELADFVVLTSPQVGLSPLRALALNFITGISVVLGGLLVTLADVNDGVLGLLLACGAGAYIYLGAVVSLPAALAGASTLENEEEVEGKARKARLRNRRALVLFSFVLGAVAIGLVLLNHKHCDEHGHDEHDEEDEDHR